MADQVAVAGAGAGAGDQVRQVINLPMPPPPKRRRRHRQNTLLPQRPKKPLSGYTVFLRNYFNTHPREAGVASHQLLTRASEAWRLLPDNQRRQYQDLCAPDIARYQNAMEVWKRQKTALKRPASAYALFVKDFWERQRAAGRIEGGVRHMGPQCKQAWDNQPEHVKNEYRQRYAVSAERFKDRMTGLHNGTISVEDLVNAVANANVAAVGADEPVIAAAAGAGEPGNVVAGVVEPPNAANLNPGVVQVQVYEDQAPAPDEDEDEDEAEADDIVDDDDDDDGEDAVSDTEDVEDGDGDVDNDDDAEPDAEDMEDGDGDGDVDNDDDAEPDAEDMEDGGGDNDDAEE